MDNFYDSLLFLLIFGMLILTGYVVQMWVPFKETRNYIKMEIERSTGDEQEKWKRELRNFYMSHIPIIGRILLNGRKKF